MFKKFIFLSRNSNDKKIRLSTSLPPNHATIKTTKNKEESQMDDYKPANMLNNKSGVDQLFIRRFNPLTQTFHLKKNKARMLIDCLRRIKSFDEENFSE